MRLQGVSGCFSCEIRRRDFLAAGCVACTGAAVMAAPYHSIRGRPSRDKIRIRIVYALHTPVQDRPDWPNIGFDFTVEMDKINQILNENCKGFEFLPIHAATPEEAEKIVENSGDVDGYLVYQMNCWNQPVKAIVTTGKPVLYVDFQYGGSGGFLVYTAELLRKNTSNFAFLASSDFEDLLQAVQCFQTIKQGGSAQDFVQAVTQLRIRRTPKPSRLDCTPDDLTTLSTEDCLRKMKESRILAFRDTESRTSDPIMGIPLQYISFQELNQAWANTDPDESRLIADRWEESAERIEGVSRKTLEESAAMYLAQKDLLKKYEANAITINCLGGFYGGHIHAYPCLGFHQLNNEGLIGACECDIRSTATMVAFTTLTKGRPGYISDPVIDTAKRQIIYAHCVAPNRMFGPEGRTNPFEILTHSEDRQGASVRSILPLGYLTTTLEIQPDRKEILFHQGKSVANDPDDRACRTKLATEPIGDIEKLFTQWDRWGWHRVTFYGDFKKSVYSLADRIGWQVVEEA